MSRRRKSIEHVNLIKLIASLSPQKQKSLISFLDENGVNLLSETVYNICYQNLGLTKRQKKKLKDKIQGQESILRFISKKSNSPKSRKKRLLQTGGFLGSFST